MSSPARKRDVWSSKLQSFVVIEDKRDDDEILPNDHTISIGRIDGKKQTFSFDSIIVGDYHEQLSLKLAKVVLLVRLGFNCSIYVNGTSKNVENSPENTVVKDQIRSLYESFTTDEKNVENGVQTGGEILLFRSVKLSCSEIFDGHIADLSLHHNDEHTKNKLGTTVKSVPSLRVMHGTVGNLTKELCPTLESALAFINHTMQLRQHLVSAIPIAPYDVTSTEFSKSTSSSSVAPQRLLGAISTLFISAEVEQLVYTIGSGESRTRSSTLQFVLFPSTEILAYKPNCKVEDRVLDSPDPIV